MFVEGQREYRNSQPPSTLHGMNPGSTPNTTCPLNTAKGHYRKIAPDC